MARSRKLSRGTVASHAAQHSGWTAPEVAAGPPNRQARV